MKKTKPKVKEKEKETDENLNTDFMKTNKENINNVIRVGCNIDIINDIVIKTNKIVIQTYQFIKLYLIHLYNTNKPFPTIDKDYISDIFRVLTIRLCGTGGCTEENMPNQLKELTKFYKEHYYPLIIKDDIQYYDKLSFILAYEAIDMVTNINVNIQEHFLQHLYKFINLSLDVKKHKDNITKENKDKNIRKEKHKEFTSEINKVKKDLTSFNDLTSNVKYHEFIIKQRKLIFDTKIVLAENNIVYDLKANTQDYLKSMFYICTELEKIYNNIKKHNENIKESDEEDNNDETNEKDIKKNKIKQIRLFNVTPLRTNIISKSICIDTCGLISNFLDKTQKTKDIKNIDNMDNKDKIKNSEKYKNKDINNNIHNIDVYNYKQNDNQYLIWNYFFRLNKKVFKKNKYNFNFMIKTDGVSISILFIRLENDKPMSKIKGKKLKGTDECSYIENAKMTDELKNKKVVVADPNKSDIIYCGSKDDKGNLETFRYTQNQRRLEIGTKKYRKIIHNVNTETKINNKTIKEIESSLSLLNSKTVNYEEFKKYVSEKNKVNNILYAHYQQEFFRKFKLNTFINTQKSESKLVKNFSNKFGKPDKTIFIMGDHDTGNYNMKGVEPIICKKIRRIFKNAGYKTYLINEYCTSKMCNSCHQELEKFLTRKSNKPKDKKKNKTILVNGLLRHEVVNPKGEQEHKRVCNIIHNRDKNAVQNMLYIVEQIKKTGKRPEPFVRQKVETTSYPCKIEKDKLLLDGL